MIEQDTISALSTASGSAAIALVRMSGPEALRVLHAVAPALPVPVPARKALHLALHDGEGMIDDALVTCFPAPHSYTGEHMVEIGVHGSGYIVQRLLVALSGHGARLAKPGEFTLRAFLNRKLDLSQAEAVADLIAAGSKAAHKLAMQQLRGGYSEHIERLRQQLIDFSALVELELDFGEEDVEFARRDDLLGLLADLLAVCDHLIDSFRYGNVVKTGVPVAIIGAPNSGKSTLLNALLQEDRAIVSDIPGTTRDTVEGTITIGGVLFRFIDTAGLRTTEDAIEKLGIERSYRKAQEASIVVLLGDASVLNESAFATQVRLLRQRIGDGAELLPVLSKADLPGVKLNGGIPAISARTGAGLAELKQRFLAHVNALHSDQSDIVVTNARHVEALGHAREALAEAQRGVDAGISGELLASDLRRAQHHLGEITGRITPDDILGSIFGRFCIGK